MKTALMCCFAAFALAGLAGPALAEDTFLMKNGDRITGFIMSDDGQRIKLGTPYGTVFLEKFSIQDVRKGETGVLTDRTFIVPPSFAVQGREFSILRMAP